MGESRRTATTFSCDLIDAQGRNAVGRLRQPIARLAFRTATRVHDLPWEFSSLVMEANSRLENKFLAPPQRSSQQGAK